MNQQRFVCVWFDNQSKQSKDSLYTQDELRTIIDSFRYFDDLNQCLDFLMSIKNVNLILITLNDEIIPIIHSSEQIHSIYILTREKYSIKDYKKIQGIFSDVKIICQKIKENIIPSKTNPIGISFISSNDIHSNDLNRQDPAFMYSQLLKEIILNDDFPESDEETKYEMITYCRNVYKDDQDTLKILDQFEQNFFPELSIYWYTRECFLYKILNKALWTPQPDVLYKLRYFLRHLHQQILSQSKSQRSGQPSMIVYRGQNMSASQIRKFKQNVGGFLSFNNFLSTSLQRDVGLSFIAGPEIGVLFEMFIDTTIEKFPFANIEHLSFQQGPQNEKELLFSMGTVFRIVGMDTEKNFHRIQLMLTSDIDEQLAEYTQRTREGIRSSCCFLSFLKLMNELKQYNNVDRFAEIFVNDRSLIIDPDVLDGIHNVFGLTYHDRGQLNDALEHFHKSLSICLITLSADHPKLAVTYNNMGVVYSAQSDYETALTYHQLALDCQINSDNPNISSVITYTNNIAAIYHQQEKYSEALEYHKRALELQKQYLGENDPSLSDTYNVISIICYKMNDYEQTSSFCFLYLILFLFVNCSFISCESCRIT
jgi:tetratricopeptide (TPR) repeat protein